MGDVCKEIDTYEAYRNHMKSTISVTVNNGKHGIEHLIMEAEQAAAAVQNSTFKDFVKDSGQRSVEWHKKRAGKFTGSRVKDLMTSGKGNKIWGETSKKYIFEKHIERLTGRAFGDPDMQTPAMKRGVELEPVAKQVYFERHEIIIEECDFIPSPCGRALGASPDGENKEHSLSFEIKCRGAMSHFSHGCEVIDESHPDFWQVQTEIHVTGSKKLIYINYNPDYEPLDLIIQEVLPSPIHMNRLLERIDEAEKHLAVMKEMSLKEAWGYCMSIN